MENNERIERLHERRKEITAALSIIEDQIKEAEKSRYAGELGLYLRRIDLRLDLDRVDVAILAETSRGRQWTPEDEENFWIRQLTDEIFRQ